MADNDLPTRRSGETLWALVCGLSEELVAGRVIILTGAAASSEGMGRFFRQAGAARVVSLDLPMSPGATNQRFTTYQRLLANPSAALRERLSVIDPHRAALIYAGSFTSVREVCGRRTIGARTDAQYAAERKDVQRQLIGNKGILHRTNAMDVPDILQDRMDQGSPVVLQGIPDDDLAMAASHTYVLPTQARRQGIERVISRLRSDSTQILVRDLDKGTPCTFYGFVAPDSIIDFGALEALVYWQKSTWRIYAFGVLHPVPLAPSVLADCRLAIHDTAARLHRVTGYVGAFGVDGTITEDGYQVHETNPRVCAGFSLLDQMSNQPIPLAAVDLLFRECLDKACAVLSAPMQAFAEKLIADSVPQVKLWEGQEEGLREKAGLDASTTPTAGWAAKVRQALAGPDLIHINDLE